MLYDPSWDRSLPTDSPRDLTRLIGWLERQVPEKRYNYNSCHGCLYGQYLDACGLRKADGRRARVFTELHQQPFLGIAAERPRTFGAALQRARAVQAELLAEPAES